MHLPGKKTNQSELPLEQGFPALSTFRCVDQLPEFSSQARLRNKNINPEAKWRWFFFFYSKGKCSWLYSSLYTTVTEERCRRLSLVQAYQEPREWSILFAIQVIDLQAKVCCSQRSPDYFTALFRQSNYTHIPNMKLSLSTANYIFPFFPPILFWS